MTVPLQFTAGSNTIEFSNPAAFAPDFDRIIVEVTPGCLLAYRAAGVG